MFFKKYFLTTAVISNILLSSFVSNASENMGSENILDVLPTELIVTIVSNLGPDDLHNVKNVSRAFKNAGDVICKQRKDEHTEHSIEKFCTLKQAQLFMSDDFTVKMAQKIISIEDSNFPAEKMNTLIIAKLKAYALLSYNITTPNHDYRAKFKILYTKHEQNKVITDALRDIAPSFIFA